jgi:signal peptidase I
MKANEMPKKIYLFDYNDAMVTPLDGDTVYVREDAFIEKARKWFEKRNEWRDINGIKHCDMESFENFVNYMKGE